MTWILIVTAVINGQVYNADKVPFKTKAACERVLKEVAQHAMFKTYNGKASCEKGRG